MANGETVDMKTAAALIGVLESDKRFAASAPNVLIGGPVPDTPGCPLTTCGQDCGWAAGERSGEACTTKPCTIQKAVRSQRRARNRLATRLCSGNKEGKNGKYRWTLD